MGDAMRVVGAFLVLGLVYAALSLLLLWVCQQLFAPEMVITKNKVVAAGLLLLLVTPVTQKKGI